MEKISLTVEQSESGERLDVFISLKTEYSRNRVQLMAQNSLVEVNGNPADKKYRVKNGDVIDIFPMRTKPDRAEPQNIPLDIYYEDDDLIVVNKPKGMVVHPADGNYDGTLVNALLYHCDGTLSGINGTLRPGIVHRIDKDTSGLLVAAKSDTAHAGLSRQFKEHTVTRVYTAITYGIIKEDEGDIDRPIGRSRTDRKKFCVDRPNSKSAFTHYKVIEKLNGFTLINAVLKTGRTHQIRVHMQSVGHPLAGDPVYGPRKVIKELDGQALHRGTLGFVHPLTGEYMEFCAPPCRQFSNFYEKVKIRDND